jgi:predicted protein tyrosine phosphatase
MNKLFVCNQGKDRSKTATELFSGKYAGIYSEDVPLTIEIVNWADIIYVMEEHHRDFIADNFPKQYMMKKIIVLEIENIYGYMQEELIKELKKVKEFKCKI